MSDDRADPRLADRLARAARAAHALSETLWEALHEELADPRARRVAELSDRLGEVSATVGLLVRAQGEGVVSSPRPPAASAQDASPERAIGGQVRPPGREGPPLREEPHLREEPLPPRDSSSWPQEDSPRVREESPSERSSWQPDEPPSAREGTRPQEERSTAVLIDELALGEPPAGAMPAGAPPAREPREIEIRDEREEESRREPGRGGEGAQAWIASIGRRVERYERDRAPFAVMLVELADVERLRHAELPGEVARLTGLVETALSGELRPADSLTRESPGRYWLLASETDAGGARTLAERLAEAVRGAASHRGIPLEVSIGIAVCPADGALAQALAARADIALYAARAAGRPVA